MGYSPWGHKESDKSIFHGILIFHFTILFHFLSLLLLFICSVMSSFLWPHGLQHARLPCPSLSSRVCSNSCPFIWWYHPTVSSSVILLLPSIFPSIRVFPKSAVHIRCPKYWSFSFSINPSKEYSELISFKIDWLDLLAFLRDSQESSPAPQFENINSLALSLLYGPTLTSVHDYTFYFGGNSIMAPGLGHPKWF